MKRITQFILCLVLAVSAYGQGVGGNSVPRTVSGISNALDLISSTQGTVFYRGASGWEALTPGTSGQLLSTQGAAANPIWVTATGGAGDMNGPASATDNAIVRFDGTGGKTVQNSAVTIADTTGAMTWSNAGGYLDLGASALTATAVNTGGLRSANFGLSTVSGGASYFGGNVTAGGSITAGGGLTVSGSTSSFGGASRFDVGLWVVPTALAFPDQFGIASSPTFTSAATSSGAAGYFKLTTAAGAYTMSSGRGVLVDPPTLGAGSSITDMWGLRILNQGAAGITNAYGIDIAAQSGAATTNIGLRNAGITSLTNSTASTGLGTGALQVAGGIYAGAASYFGGAVSVARTATVGSVGGFDTDLVLNASATTQATAISFQSSGTNNWKIGRGVATGGTELAIRNESLAANALTFTLANSAATFAGAVTATLGTNYPPQTAPASPASGWVLYTDSGDGNKLKAKASTGTVVTIGTP